MRVGKSVKELIVQYTPFTSCLLDEFLSYKFLPYKLALQTLRNWHLWPLIEHMYIVYLWLESNTHR